MKWRRTLRAGCATLGAWTALLLAAWPAGRRWLLPLLLISQAVPVFAIAPLLTLWLGFGSASKVALATCDLWIAAEMPASPSPRCGP